MCGKRKQSVARQQTILKQKDPLSVSHPDLAVEWLTEKNDGLTPDRITSGSGKRVWWKCKTCGNVWEAVICERTRDRAKCRVCKSGIGR